MIDMSKARRIGNWTVHVNGPRRPTVEGGAPKSCGPSLGSEELDRIIAESRSPSIEWREEWGTSGYLVGVIRRMHAGCHVVMSVRVDPHRPYRIFAGRKALAERLATPAELLAAIERCWKRAVGVLDKRDLELGRQLGDIGLSCYLVAANCFEGDQFRRKQEILCTEFTSVADSRFSFRLELGRRNCFLHLWSGRRYKVRNREILRQLMVRMTAGALDLRRTPAELPVAMVTAFELAGVE